MEQFIQDIENGLIGRVSLQILFSQFVKDGLLDKKYLDLLDE